MCLLQNRPARSAYPQMLYVVESEPIHTQRQKSRNTMLALLEENKAITMEDGVTCNSNVITVYFFIFIIGF